MKKVYTVGGIFSGVHNYNTHNTSPDARFVFKSVTTFTPLSDLKDPRSLSELEKKLRNESAVKLGVRDYGRVKDHADWGCDVAGDAGEIQLGYDRTRGAWTFLGWKLQEM